jgi:Ca2+-binding RTX toxin-like protein
MIGEGGDDIFVGSDAQDKMDGMSGFDWVTYKNDKIGVTVDLELAALNEPPVAASPASILDRFAEVEGLSGSRFADYLRGSEADANEIATFNAKTSALDAAGIARVAGLQTLLNDALGGLRPLQSPASVLAILFLVAMAATSSLVWVVTILSTATNGSTSA